MRDCINDNCEYFNDLYKENCGDVDVDYSRCSNYASHTVTVKFLPDSRSMKHYTYFTKFKPYVRETLLRVGKEVVVKSFRKSSMDAKYFVERLNTDNEENKTMKNEFDSALQRAKKGSLTAINTINGSAMDTATRVGTTVKRVKVGRLAIAAIKSALRNTPGVPAPIKLALESEYADIVIGAVAPIVIPLMTKNSRAITLGEDIAIAGGVAVADKLTFIDDFVVRITKEVREKLGENLNFDAPIAEDDPEHD